MSGPTRDEAIVLRSVRLGETSKIVSALTATWGRVKLVARGSRTVGSRLGTLLEPGNELEMVLYPRPGKDLWTLSDASLRRAALTGSSTLDKLSHLFAALELADRLFPEQESIPELEALYRSFLDAWHREEDAGMPALFFALELELLERTGLGLDPRRCAECGTPLTGVASPAGRALFRVAEGTLTCPACGFGGGRWLEAPVLGALAAVAEVGLGSSSTSPVPKLAPADRREVGRLLHEHMGFHLPSYRLPRALYWLAPRGAESLRSAGPTTATTDRERSSRERSMQHRSTEDDVEA